MRFAGAPRRMHVLPIALALAGAALVLALAFTRLDIRTDMTDLLPRGKTDAARMMLDELRSGPATSLILVGIEGAPPETLARISRAMRGSMQRSGLFAFIENGGGEELGGSDEQFLFRNRYLLSPAVTADAFTVPALRDDFRHLLDALQSSAGPLAAQFGFADPTGAFLGLLRDWAGASPVRTINGVWFAADRDRALMLLRTRAPGMESHGPGEGGRGDPRGVRRRGTRIGAAARHRTGRVRPRCGAQDSWRRAAAFGFLHAVDRRTAVVAFPLALGDRRDRRSCAAQHRRRRASRATRIRVRAWRHARFRDDHARRHGGLPRVADRSSQAGRGRRRDAAPHRPGFRAGGRNRRARAYRDVVLRLPGPGAARSVLRHRHPRRGGHHALVAAETDRAGGFGAGSGWRSRPAAARSRRCARGDGWASRFASERHSISSLPVARVGNASLSRSALCPPRARPRCRATRRVGRARPGSRRTRARPDRGGRAASGGGAIADA